MNKFGLIDILTSAATVHCNNSEILPIIEHALEIINPSAEWAESVLESVIANINNESIVAH